MEELICTQPEVIGMNKNKVWGMSRELQAGSGNHSKQQAVLKNQARRQVWSPTFNLRIFNKFDRNGTLGTMILSELCGLRFVEMVLTAELWFLID